MIKNMEKVRNDYKEMMPFSEKNYNLSVCDLQHLNNENVYAISETLASMDPWYTLGYDSNNLSKYLLRNDPSLLKYEIVILNNNIAGLICIRYPWLFGPLLELIAIYMPNQDKGIGHAILSWIENQIALVERNIWTVVSSFNLRARKFYKRFGFFETAQLSGLIKPGFDEILLRKEIKIFK